MRSRAVILPDCGDPFVALTWLHFFERWRTEVDRLYFSLNSPVQKEIVDVLRREVERLGGVFLRTGAMKKHGDAIRDTLLYVQEKHVLLVENDGIIHKPGAVDKAFGLLESGEYDIVAGDRSPASLTLDAAARKRFGIERPQHPFFWPNFFFTDVPRLLRTDGHYGYKVWTKGEYIKELDWTVKCDPGWETVECDTFAWTSIQLRNEHPKVKLLDQYHSQVDDERQELEKVGPWAPEASWFHYGSVSSGYFQLLQDEEQVPLMFRACSPERRKKEVVDLSVLVDKRWHAEYERRIAWWDICQDLTWTDLPSTLRAEYLCALINLTSRFGFSKERIFHRARAYKKLLGI